MKPHINPIASFEIAPRSFEVLVLKQTSIPFKLFTLR